MFEQDETGNIWEKLLKKSESDAKARMMADGRIKSEAEWREFQLFYNKGVVVPALDREPAEPSPYTLEDALEDNIVHWPDENRPKPTLLDFEEWSVESLEAFEFVIEGVIGEGTTVFAGESGAGKSSLLVGMALCAAGLTTDVYQLKSTEKRRLVVYAAEDIGQVRRVIAAMIKDGTVVNDLPEIKRYFKIVASERQVAEKLAAAGPTIRKLTLAGDRADGQGSYDIEPLVVLDTTNANIDLEDENSNTLVGKAISTLRQGFKGVNVWMVAHTAKATEGKKVSARGAGAFKGDVQQLVLIYKDATLNWLIMDLSDKARGELDGYTYVLNKRTQEVMVTDKRGNQKLQYLVYGQPELITEEMIELERESIRVAKEVAKEGRAADKAAQNRERIASDVLKWLEDSPSAVGITELRENITGSNDMLADVLSDLVDSGKVARADKKYELPALE